jgi:phospholipid transport system substrate-binding protein
MPTEPGSFRVRAALLACCAALVATAAWAGGAEARPTAAGMLAVSDSPAPSAGTAPDTLLIAATQAVIAVLRQNRDLQLGGPGRLADTIESNILPLFDFEQMTQLAMARNWRLASPGQQSALTAEFKALLVRSYSSVLANYRNQTIQYLPWHMIPDQTQTTVKSSIRRPGAEPIAIDYDMEKTAAGWKVYDIKLTGISLITTYQENFAQTVRDVGVDGLINALHAKNAAGGAKPASGYDFGPRHQPLASAVSTPWRLG